MQKDISETQQLFKNRRLQAPVHDKALIWQAAEKSMQSLRKSWRRIVSFPYRVAFLVCGLSVHRPERMYSRK